MENKLKTGTTCLGLIFKDGVLLAADRRTTAGFVASDSSIKVYDITKNILATTAGNAAANQLVMRHLKKEANEIRLKNERDSKVCEIAYVLNSIQYSILRSQGEVVSVILGGYDKFDKLSLYNLSPDGTILSHEGYVVDGSGSIYIKGVLDNEYDKNMSKEDALKLVEKCFKTSFKNDIYSGGGFIAKIVNENGIEIVDKKKIESKFIEEK